MLARPFEDFHLEPGSMMPQLMEANQKLRMFNLNLPIENTYHSIQSKRLSVVPNTQERVV